MQPVTLPRSDHPISRKHIDPDALKVLYRLKQAGHVAYLVGGGVRDLLLGRRPKDFDVSTSAHPNEVRKLFRNCRLIGRRFRLAHILFGAGKVIEVATFRRKSDDEPESGDDLLVRRENTFGTPEEDAERRDFTINGLFYDIATFSVIDYVGGLKDLSEQVIRTIGDPAVRLREDPVRMLRAMKFAARLGFHISPEDLVAIRQHRGDLLRAAPERLLLELTRLLGSGTAEAALRLLDQTGLLETVAPEVVAYLGQRPAGRAQDVLWKDLAGLDGLIARRRESGLPDLPQPVLLGAIVTPMVIEALGGDNGQGPAAPVFRRGLGFAAGLEIADIQIEGGSSAGRSRATAAMPAGELTGDEEDREDGFDTEIDPGPEPANPDAGGGIEPVPTPAVAAARSLRPTLPAAAGDPVAQVAELLAPLVVRLAVPRRDTEQLIQVVAAQGRLRAPGRRPGPQRALARRHYFPDALILLEAHVLGTHHGETELRLWRSIAEREGSPEEPRGREAGRRRRRRPERRRRRDADSDLVPVAVAPIPADSLAEDDSEASLRRKAEAEQRRRETAYDSQPFALTHHGSTHPSYANPAPPPDAGDRPARRRRRRRGRGGSREPVSSTE